MDSLFFLAVKLSLPRRFFVPETPSRRDLSTPPYSTVVLRVAAADNKAPPTLMPTVCSATYSDSVDAVGDHGIGCTVLNSVHAPFTKVLTVFNTIREREGTRYSSVGLHGSW